MLNMNSPTVQNLMQTSGFNPYNNYQQPIYNPYNNYQPQVYQQPIYNPYIQLQNTNITELEYYYDPMPAHIVNEARGINAQISCNNNIGNNYNQIYNNQAFYGYMNPIIMRNQMENQRIQQREEAIQQGKIWRILLHGEAEHNKDFDLDEMVHRIESLYYFEPIQQELSLKEKMVIDKNNRIAEIDARAEYYKQNNIPMYTNLDLTRAKFYGYYNHINSIIGDIENCNMMDYFTRVYPQLLQEELMYKADKYNKNLKNSYNNKDYNKLLNQESSDKPDSYYSKLMETFADSGVKLETSNGLVITADEMEIKLPERLLKNSQDEYYEKRRKFYDAIFKKEG